MHMQIFKDPLADTETRELSELASGITPGIRVTYYRAGIKAHRDYLASKLRNLLQQADAELQGDEVHFSMAQAAKALGDQDFAAVLNGIDVGLDVDTDHQGIARWLIREFEAPAGVVDDGGPTADPWKLSTAGAGGWKTVFDLFEQQPFIAKGIGAWSKALQERFDEYIGATVGESSASSEIGKTDGGSPRSSSGSASGAESSSPSSAVSATKEP